MAKIGSEIKHNVTGFWKSAERDYVIAGGTAILGSFFVVPKVNQFVEGYTKNVQYTGIIDLLAGGALMMLAFKASDGWAAAAAGMSFSFLVEGAVRVVFPQIATTATQQGLPALVTAIGDIHL